MTFRDVYLGFVLKTQGVLSEVETSTRINIENVLTTTSVSSNIDILISHFTKGCRYIVS